MQLETQDTACAAAPLVRDYTLQPFTGITEDPLHAENPSGPWECRANKVRQVSGSAVRPTAAGWGWRWGELFELWLSGRWWQLSRDRMKWAKEPCRWCIRYVPGCYLILSNNPKRQIFLPKRKQKHGEVKQCAQVNTFGGAGTGPPPPHASSHPILTLPLSFHPPRCYLVLLFLFPWWLQDSFFNFLCISLKNGQRRAGVKKTVNLR